MTYYKIFPRDGKEIHLWVLFELDPILTGHGISTLNEYRYGEYSTFSIGYENEDKDVHICPVTVLILAIIFILVISLSSSKLLKYSLSIK